MPLKLLPMEESDVDTWSYLVCTSFERGLMSLMYPKGLNQADREYMNTSTLKAIRSPDVKFLKVVDTETQENGGIIGVSQWKFFPKPRTEEELAEADKKAGEDGFAPSADQEMMKDFFGVVDQCKKDIIGGNAYVLLHILATLPNHHRRGVGALHLKWGIDEADKLGLPVYLEASEMGRPLYARWGFEDVKPLPFDARKYGAKTSMPHMCMLRPMKAMHGSA